MTEAIKTLKENICAQCAYGSDMENCDIRYCDNREAIKILEQEPCEDAISREEALKALRADTEFVCTGDKLQAIKDISSLPTVTPERPNVNDVLDKIRDEIKQLHHHPKLDFINTDKVVDMAIEIIDKYTKSEDKE
jgi:hypothetical protein